jgi:hypothetical protein
LFLTVCKNNLLHTNCLIWYKFCWRIRFSTLIVYWMIWMIFNNKMYIKFVCFNVTSSLLIKNYAWYFYGSRINLWGQIGWKYLTNIKISLPFIFLVLILLRNFHQSTISVNSKYLNSFQFWDMGPLKTAEFFGT